MVRRLLIALVVLAAAPSNSRAGEQAMDEYQAMAAFISNVVAFVEWPESVLAHQGPIEIAVLGRPAGEEVKAALAGRSATRRQLVVRVYDRAAEIGDAHVLFVTADARDDMRTALRAVANKAVLTIAEGTLDSAPPAVITLFVVETRLAFAVDLDIADAHRVRPAANLLQLAHRVRGRKVSTHR
jgi:hypothetical protein